MCVSAFRFNIIKIITMVVILAFIAFATWSQKVFQVSVSRNDGMGKRVCDSSGYAYMYAKPAAEKYTGHIGD